MSIGGEMSQSNAKVFENKRERAKIDSLIF